VPNYFAEFEPSRDRGPSGWQHGTAHFRAFVITLCVILLGGFMGLNLLKTVIKNELPSRIIAEVNQRLASSGFVFDLEDAQWTEGQGLKLVGMRFADRNTGQIILDCDDAFAQSNFHLTDVLNGLPNIERLTLDGLKVKCHKHSDSRWNLQVLVEALQSEPSSLSIDCPIEILDSEVTLDARSFGIDEVFRFSELHCVHSRPMGVRGVHSVVGQIRSDVTERLDFQLRVDQTTGIWSVTCAANRVEINDRLTRMIRRHATSLSNLETLRGQIAFNLAATGRLGDLPSTIFEIAGRSWDLQCLDRGLPHPLHDGSFEFRVDNKQASIPTIKIENARAGLGYGSASLNFAIVDPLGDSKWRLNGKVEKIELTERILPWIKPEMQKVWHEYQPGGKIDAEFALESVGGVITRDIRANIHDGSFSWYRFPYPLSQCNGRVSWIGDQMGFELTAIEAQQTIEMKGLIQNPGPHWTGWLEGNCNGQIPINEKMLQAFDTKPELARTLRKFNANGHIKGKGRLTRSSSDEQVHRAFDIELLQATIRHENFNYPIYNVGGLIRVGDQETEFLSLKGQNNNGQIACHGHWNHDDGLRLHFLANHVLLNDELRLALPVHLQNTWAGLRPNGAVDQVDLDLHYPRNAEQPIVKAQLEIANHDHRVSPVSMNPIWFPYELRQVAGSFRFEDRVLKIVDFSAQHDDTSIRANGVGYYDETRWQLRLSDMFVRNIDLDHDLRHALPSAIALGADQINFAGDIGMRGELTITGAMAQLSPSANASSYVGTVDPQTPSANIDWKLEFGITRAVADIGLPLRNINGLLRLAGGYAGDKVACDGHLIIDSMMYQNIQVTSAVIPLSLDNTTIGIGESAKAYRNRTQRMPAMGNLFGGRFACNATVDLRDENAYSLQATLVEGKLEQFASEMSMTQHDFSGLGSAEISLSGNASGTHSMRGKGKIALKNAKIYQVPVIVALLNVLRIKEPDRTAFDTAQIDFEVNGEHFDIGEIELNGDAMSLIGEGTVDLDSNIDLDFYSLIGRNGFKIPVITELYKRGSQQFWWIKVNGTLDDPITEHEVLPGLNDTLKRLFPELSEADQ
jgi:hypothetical protein